MILPCALVALCLHVGANALFEDQIGKFDWRLQFVGEIRYALSDRHSASKDPPIFVSTEDSVLAALNVDNGNLVWRQVLDEQANGASEIVLADKYIITLSPCLRLLRAWSKSDGLLNWEVWLSDERKSAKTHSKTDYAHFRSEGARSILPLTVANGRKFVFVLGKTGGYMVDLTNGEIVVNMADDFEGDENIWLGAKVNSNASRIYAVRLNYLKNQIITLTIYLDTNGRLYEYAELTLTLPSGTELRQNRNFTRRGSCVLLESGKLVCLSKSGTELLHCDAMSTEHLQLEESLTMTPFSGASDNGVSLLASHIGAWFVVHDFPAKTIKVVTEENMGKVVLVANDVQCATADRNNLIIVTSKMKDRFTTKTVVYDMKRPEEPKKMHETDMDGYTENGPLAKRIFTLSHFSPPNDGTFQSMVINWDNSVRVFGKMPSSQTAAVEKWSRDEALSEIVAVQMVDLPLSESQADIETEFEGEDSSIISMLVRRLKTQATQARRALISAGDSFLEAVGLLEKFGSVARVFDLRHDLTHTTSNTNPSTQNTMSTHSRTPPFVRDYFNLHKMIVACTSSGSIYGLDSRNGGVLWQLYLGEGVGPMRVQAGQSEPEVCPLYVLRTTAHHPLSAMAVVVYKNKRTNLVQMAIFNPISGALLEQKTIAHKVSHVALLPQVDDKTQVQMLMLAEPSLGVVTLYPDIKLDIVQPPVYVMNVLEKTSHILLEGHKMKSVGGTLRFENVWKTELPLSARQRLHKVLSKNPNQRVHSMGRVLGDRNVLYKYVNPNLVAIFVAADVNLAGSQLSDDVVGEIAEDTRYFVEWKLYKRRKRCFGGSLTVYLVDAVTGNVVMQEKHGRSQPPIHVVHCENWLLYTYWNEKARRTELTVSELYEGLEQSDHQVSSSLAPLGRQPTIFTQSYIFPQGVSALGVTETERGLTHRMLLAAMPMGGLLEIPKQLLDPRRPLNPTQMHREEGLYPYVPEIPVGTQSVFNYNQSVMRITRIESFSSGLESTALVLASGLDVFYTRLTPSGTFDVLKDDFDHWIISAALLGLLIASAVTKKLARRRDLQQAWK